MEDSKVLKRYSQMNRLYWIRRMYLWALSLAQTRYASSSLFGLCTSSSLRTVFTPLEIKPKIP
jgi:hypothetical protein